MARQNDKIWSLEKIALVGALFAFALINMLQFMHIDDKPFKGYTAIDRYWTADIVDIALKEGSHISQSHGLYLALAKIAPGSNIVVSEGSYYSRADVVFRPMIFGIGLADSVTPAEYDINDLSFLPITDTTKPPTSLETPYHVADRGEGGRKGRPWAIIVDKRMESNSKKEFAVFQTSLRLVDSTIYLIETSLISTNILEEHKS